MDIKKVTEFIKNGNNRYILLIILVGVVFMLFSGGGDEKERVENNPIIFEEAKEEERLEKILSAIKGVEEIEVMISYYSTTKTDIAYQTKRFESTREEENAKSSDETLDKQAITASGEPYVTQYIYPEVKGVVVVARGVWDINVKKSITDAVICATGVAPHKVCVVEKN